MRFFVVVQKMHRTNGGWFPTAKFHKPLGSHILWKLCRFSCLQPVGTYLNADRLWRPARSFNLRGSFQDAAPAYEPSSCAPHACTFHAGKTLASTTSCFSWFFSQAHHSFCESASCLAAFGDLPPKSTGKHCLPLGEPPSFAARDPRGFLGGGIAWPGNAQSQERAMGGLLKTTTSHRVTRWPPKSPNLSFNHQEGLPKT